jgi:hypothetical protein
MIFFNHGKENWSDFPFQVDIIGTSDPTIKTSLLFNKGGTDINSAPQIRVGLNTDNADLTSGDH